jgi:hypothetical protein
MSNLIIIAACLFFGGSFGCNGRAVTSAPPSVPLVVAGVRITKLSSIPSDSVLRDINFITRRRGWVASGDRVWKTMDAGESWREQFALKTPTDSIHSILFTSESQGYIGTSREVYHTDDGGETWTATDLMEENVSIERVVHTKDGSIWLVGGRAAEPRNPDILVRPRDVFQPFLLVRQQSSSGWSKMPSPKSRGNLDDLVCNARRDCLAIGDGDDEMYVFSHSTRRWSNLSLDCSDPNERRAGRIPCGPKAISTDGLSNFWLSDSHGALFVSSDYGVHWTRVEMATQSSSVASGLNYFQILVFSDSLQGLGLMGNGLLFRTTDGGRSWSAVGPEHMAAISLVEKYHAFGIEDNSVYRIELGPKQ